MYGLHTIVTATANMDESPAEEKRFGFIKDIVLQTLKIKKDQWQKCVGVDEHKQVIQDFLDKSDHKTLFFSQNANGQLTPTNEFPLTSMNKAVYFIKRSQTALSVDTMKTDLMYGDMSYSPLAMFSNLIQRVSEESFCTVADRARALRFLRSATLWMGCFPNGSVFAIKVSCAP